MLVRNISFYALGATALLSGVTSPALADSTRIALQSWDPAAARPDGLRTLVDRPEGLESMMRTGWDAARGRACDEVTSRLPAAIRRHDAGALAKDITCTFGPATAVTVKKHGRGLATVVVIPSNTVRLKVELDAWRPDVWIDVPFAMTIRIVASPDGQGRLLTLDAVTTSIDAGAVKIDGATPVGDIALKVAAFLRIDIPGTIAKALESQSIPMGGVVTQFNTVMTQSIPGAVAQAASISIWQRGGVTLFVLKPAFPALPRAAISGTVVAAKGMPDCAGFSFNAAAQGPGSLTDPFASQAAFAAGISAESGEAVSTGNGGPVGLEGVPSERRCSYRIADAPIGHDGKIQAANSTPAKPQKHPIVYPNELAARAPAINVNFQTSWGFNGNVDYLEQKFPGQKPTLHPGDTASHGMDDRVRTVDDRVAQPGQVGRPSVSQGPIWAAPGRIKVKPLQQR